MKRLTCFLPLLFLFFSQAVFAQDFTAVDEHARNVPASKATSVEKLARHLTGQYSSEKEKARAIYVWMADNVKYSTATVSKRSLSVEQRLKRQEPERVLRSKRAVCEGYSNLYMALCEAAGLKALTVTGYTKLPDGKIAPVGHAWNLVRINNKWNIIDATWGAGGIDGQNGKYIKSLSDEFFMADPESFIQHHLPHDPLFQLLPEAVTYDYFKKNEDIIISGENNNIDLHEKLDLYYGLEKEEQVLASSQRAVDFDAHNGFANFTLSKHHYELALSAYHEFYDDSQKAFDKKLPLTTPMVDKWEASLNVYKKQLKKAESYLGKIRPNDPVSDAARQSKIAIRQAWKVSKETDKQFVEYRRWLNKNKN